MPRLIISRGISGSGKSTWAREQNAVVVSRDTIRVALFGGFTMKDEPLVSLCQDAMITAALRAGKDVIVDNTNIEWRYVKALAKLGYANGADVEIKVFDVTLDKAIRRVKHRASFGGLMVPEDVIAKQHTRFQGSKNNTLDPVVPPAPYTGTPGKPKAFLVDIDGTLAHMNDKRGPFDWKKVGLDDVDEVIANLVEALYFSPVGPFTVILMSGRDASCRSETINWLNEHAIPWDHLFMRPEKDMRPDNIIKAELFDTHIRDNYDVQFVIDDRAQVVRMWKTMGLKVLNVAGLDDGEF